MRLPDCASNVDVKNVQVCPNRLNLRGVTVRQKLPKITKTPCILLNYSDHLSK